MANLKDIKRRIGTVKNTGKITQAMKLVSAAKFAKASHAVSASRPYSKTFGEVVSKIVASGVSEEDSPLVVAREEKTALMIIVATDRGLCGSLNTNLFKQVDKWIAEKKEKGVSIKIAAWGRRAASYADRLKDVDVVERKEKVLEKIDFYKAKTSVREYIDSFVEESFDSVYLAYNIFESALTQHPVVDAMLPISMEVEEGNEIEAVDVIMEPSQKELIPTLLDKKISFQVFQALLDGAASEHGARMSAMDSATRNSKEVEKKLTIEYNRARQAAITKELIEIVSGAEAL